MVIGDAMSAPWTFLSRMRTRGRPELTAPSSRQPPTRCWPRCVIRRMRKSFLCCAGAGERGRLSENLLAIMWGWSRRTDGQALKGGGRQQAALKRSGKTRASHGRDSPHFTVSLWYHFRRTQLFFEVAAELRKTGFNVERLALKAKSSFLLCYPFCASMLRFTALRSCYHLCLPSGHQRRQLIQLKSG